MTLGCRAFFTEFLVEFERDRAAWERMFDDKYNRKWTIKMLGTKASRKKADCGLLGRIGQKFGYEVYPEWRRIDQVWSYDLPKPEGWKQKDAPWRNDVVVEHENDIANLEYTFNKFGEISAPLKVGIFYPDKKREAQVIEKAQEMVLKQVSSFPGEVYLIVLGFSDPKKHIYWHAYEIDFKGNAIQLNT